jgi:hypothetical protein
VRRLLGYLFEAEAWLTDHEWNIPARAVQWVTKKTLRIWDGRRVR